MSEKYISIQDAVDALAKTMPTPATPDGAGEFDHEIHIVDEAFVDAIRIIESLEPVDVVPVRHGKWKKIGEWGRVYRCNQCGNFLDFDGVNAGRGAANFCPNCGAKMDGKRKG